MAEAVTIANQRRLDDLWDALGSHGKDLLADPEVTDIMISNGEMFVDRLGHVQPAGVVVPDSQAKRLIANAAKLAGVTSAGRVGVDLPTGERFSAVSPPISKGFVVSIRKHYDQSISLEEYRNAGQMTARQYDAVVRAAEDRKNVLISGPAFVGKTTFMKAFIALPPFIGDRVCLIEDTPELPLLAPQWISLHCRKPNEASDLPTATEMVQESLRHRVGRLVIGEVRGEEALDLIDACNLGSPGNGSIHADSAPKTLLRVEQLILRRTERPMREIIIDTIDMIIHIRPDPVLRRKISDVCRPVKWDGGRYIVEPIAD